MSMSGFALQILITQAKPGGAEGCRPTPAYFYRLRFTVAVTLPLASLAEISSPGFTCAASFSRLP